MMASMILAAFPLHRVSLVFETALMQDPFILLDSLMRLNIHHINSSTATDMR